MNKVVKLNLHIFSQNAQLGMDFIPIIGQHGINLKNFCDEFNNMTSVIHKGFLLRLTVIINKNKTFIIKMKGIHLPFLIKYIIGENQKKISKYQLYIIFSIIFEFNQLFDIDLPKDIIFINVLDKLEKLNIDIVDELSETEEFLE